MRNKLKQYIPFVIVSIPFMFWYSGVIVGQDTSAGKLGIIGVISFFHIILSTILYFAKKDYERFKNKKYKRNNYEGN